MNYIDELMDDSNNKGILLYVDSPGGTVYESEELYQKLKEYKETTKRPIWDYMAHYAASGGYMVSMASDKNLCKFEYNDRFHRCDHVRI